MLGTKSPAAAAESQAPVGQPVDQRTGQPMAIGAIPQPGQLAAQLTAQSEAEKHDRAELVAYLEEVFAPQATVDGRTIDTRKLAQLVQAEFEAIERMADGIAGALARARAARAAKPTNTKSRERDLAAELETATVKAKALLEEMEKRSGWVFANILANKANEQRLQELIDNLTGIESKHHLGVDVGRWLKLPGDCAVAAGQRLQIEGRAAADGYLPGLEHCPELPEEFRRSKTIAAKQEVDQRGKPFDPNLPKDHALRMAAGSVPAPRNADGTRADVSIRDPWLGNTSGAVVPRTEAQSRAARAKVAAEVAAEDGG